MGHIGFNTAMKSRVKSRSGLKEKLDIIDMKANPNRAEIDEILANIPKGERNRNPTAIQYSINCPSFGVDNCNKTFCVAKNWLYISPLNSDGTRNQFMYTVPTNSRACTTPIKYHTYYLQWHTTTFVIYILIIYSNMEGIITIKLIMMKKLEVLLDQG